jgi:DNA-binding NtrC family response regulator
MDSRIRTLLLHAREEPLRSLKVALDKHSIENVRARSCGQAIGILGHGNPPHVILTDLTVSDSTWADALLLAHRSPVPVNMIVVSRVADLALWRAAMECGAFRYVTLPLADSELHSLVQQAAAQTVDRRGHKMVLARTA